MGPTIADIDRLIADLDDLASQASGEQSERLKELRDALNVAHEPASPARYEIIRVPGDAQEEIFGDPLLDRS